MSKSRPNLIRVSRRAHELAGHIDPSGDRGRAVEFALELAALIEWRGERPEIGAGPETRHAADVLRAYLETRRDFELMQVSQSLELLALAAKTEWPDGGSGIRALAAWLDRPKRDHHEEFRQLCQRDDLLRVLRRVYRSGWPQEESESKEKEE